MTPMTKNVTKLARWWLDSCLKNMMNQGDCAGDIIVLDEALNCVASGVYLHCTGDKPDKTKPWLTECRSRPILLIVVSCNFSDVTEKGRNFIAKRSMGEKSELESKLERMEEKEDSPEVSLSVVANFHTDIPSAAQDEQPPSEQFAQ